MRILRKRAQSARVYIHQIRVAKTALPSQDAPYGEGAPVFAVSDKSSKESTMLLRKKSLWVIVIIAVLIVTGTVLGNAAAQKASVPKPQNKLAMGENEVKQLLPLMNTDTKGMISKQEFMKFMEAEFERLDKNKKGELNVKELTQSDLTASRFAGK
jgi:hypothetical protein